MAQTNWFEDYHKQDMAFLTKVMAEKTKAKQKVLDKVIKKVYNIRTRIEGGSATEYCVDIGNLEKNKNIITDVGKILAFIAVEEFGGMRPPVIAGGLIRDYIFGVRPKDIDVFFDISHLDDDEAEDYLCCFASVFSDLLKGKEKAVPYKMGESYGEKADFLVYGLETYLDPYELNTEVQFIGHRDPRLSSENPVDFLDCFDYNLVKGLFDPVGGKFKLHDDLVKALESGKKEIYVDNDISHRRAFNFNRKLPLGHKWNIRWPDTLKTGSTTTPTRPSLIEIP